MRRVFIQSLLFLCLATSLSFAQENQEEAFSLSYDNGFKISRQDLSLKVNGWMMFDFKGFEGSHPIDNSFDIRRARLKFSGDLSQDFAYTLYLNLSGGSSTLLRAYLDYKKYEAFSLRLGQYATPFGLENDGYSSRWVHFTERSLASSNLAPDDDVGVQVFGTCCESKLKYAFSAHNGTGPNASDNNSSKHVAGRFVAQPFQGCGCPLRQDLYLGGSFSAGREDSSLSGNAFTTASGTAFTTYASTAMHSGSLLRAGGELEWLVGPFALSGEYIRLQRKNVQMTTSAKTVTQKAWYVAAAYLLTGEDQLRSAPIRALKEFDPDKNQWGAWELHARYERFNTDKESLQNAFVSGTDSVRTTTAGLSWFPNIHVKLVADAIFNNFKEELTVSGKRLKHENAFITRAQFSF